MVAEMFGLEGNIYF